MEYFALTVLGLCVGSFANVCIHRLPQGQSLWQPPSHCPSCQAPIPWRDNIPLVSYLLLKGRCRRCGERISPRYPIVEALCGALWFITGTQARMEPALLVPGLVLMSGLLIAAFTDLDCRLIPNEITITLLAAGLALSFWNPALGNEGLWRVANALGGMASGGGLLWLAGAAGQRLFKKDAMGWGDIKLAAGMGAFLGWKGTLTAMVISSLLGALCGFALILLGKIEKRGYIPFGPFLSLGGIIVWLSPVLK